jgi:hypothetical protein
MTMAAHDKPNVLYNSLLHQIGASSERKFSPAQALNACAYIKGVVDAMNLCGVLSKPQADMVIFMVGASRHKEACQILTNIGVEFESMLGR